jgi:hypothetical protein
MLELVPFQFSMVVPPMAQMSLAETAAIPVRLLDEYGFGSGLETTLQLVPSQCSNKIRSSETFMSPAAQTSVVETAVTVLRIAPLGSVALETTLQLVPFQCSINVLRELTVAPL